MRAISKTIAAIATSAALMAGLAGCSVLDFSPSNGSLTGGKTVEEPSSEPIEIALGPGDYFMVTDVAQVLYEAPVGSVVSAPLDELGRATASYGQLTPSLRDAAQAAGRQDITADPSGWNPSNEEVTIPAREAVENSTDYNGWFWNRSHLVADSLGGDAVVENLVTGTRTQNVGSTQVGGQYAGGMAYTELIARDYLDAQADDSCPLYYAATPVYTDDELVPRTVVVDVLSCDEEINIRVEVENAANGFAIDYRTGAFQAVQ